MTYAVLTFPTLTDLAAFVRVAKLQVYIINTMKLTIKSEFHGWQIELATTDYHAALLQPVEA